MADVPLVNNPMTAVADSIIGGTVTGGVAAPTRLKNNWSAAVAPTVNEDSGDGYAIGSTWIDTTADKAYVALDVTVGAAVWTEITAGGGGSVATDAIWDAAGDLAVGTGANTAARLAIGAAGGALSRVNGAVAWNSGTSFPTAATGDRYWRTDLESEFFYNGTRWLTTTLFRADIQGTAQAISATTTGGIVSAPFLGGCSDTWLEDLRTSIFISGGTALDASNKWVATLQKIAQDSVTVNTIATVTFDSGASSVWRDLTNTIDALLNNGTVQDTLQISWTKTGTPGALSFGCQLTYRMVAT